MVYRLEAQVPVHYFTKNSVAQTEGSINLVTMNG